jgi:hypothetical protein
MVRALLNVVLLTAGIAKEEPLVPWFVPRSITLGVFVNPPMASPHFRLSWEGALIDQPRNALLWTVGVGSGAGLNPQFPMTGHFQHSLVGGVAFQTEGKRFLFGFCFTGGAVWYRAGYARNSGYLFENQVLPYLEGRVQVGIKVLPHLRLSPYLGYGSPPTILSQFPGQIFIGGVDIGVVVNWR